MTRLVYCGDRTCVHNKDGKCYFGRIALNEENHCMGYNPIAFMQNSGQGEGSEPAPTEVSHAIGFSIPEDEPILNPDEEDEEE